MTAQKTTRQKAQEPKERVIVTITPPIEMRAFVALTGEIAEIWPTRHDSHGAPI
jgi:hypothetical protein